MLNPDFRHSRIWTLVVIFYFSALYSIIFSSRSLEWLIVAFFGGVVLFFIKLFTATIAEEQLEVTAHRYNPSTRTLEFYVPNKAGKLLALLAEDDSITPNHGDTVTIQYFKSLDCWKITKLAKRKNT